MLLISELFRSLVMLLSCVTLTGNGYKQQYHCVLMV